MASDGTLPEVGVSFFDGNQVLHELKTQLEKERDRISDLDSILQNHRNVIDDLENSISYRLGRTLSWPLRRIFGRA
jgi:hypothetical protein